MQILRMPAQQVRDPPDDPTVQFKMRCPPIRMSVLAACVVTLMMVGYLFDNRLTIVVSDCLKRHLATQQAVPNIHGMHSA
jgi:hypothetical protein